MPAPRHIAVIDIGKTNAKVVLIDRLTSTAGDAIVDLFGSESYGFAIVSGETLIFGFDLIASGVNAFAGVFGVPLNCCATFRAAISGRR